MNNCSNHTRDIAGITDMKQLAEMIGDLHYEVLAELLNELAKKFFIDSENDKEGGRIDLSRCLLWIHYGVHKASYGAEKAWQISKPFMK